MKPKRTILAGLFVFSLVPSLTAAFDLSNPRIPLDEIHSGGPPKDGIPALTNPSFVSMEDAAYLNGSDRVIGVALNGQAKAYPYRILNWHEIVNDKIDGKPILVTYCPLCGTGMVFDAMINGKRRTFGVSGLLYNSDVLMYDRQNEGLWSQLKMEAVTGPEAGKNLTLLPSHVTTWTDWKKRFPQTKALSIETGHVRDYARDPYRLYRNSEKTMFPVNIKDNSRHAKEWIFGIIINGLAKGYPFKELDKTDGQFWDVIGQTKVQILYNSQYQSVTVKDKNGNILPGVQVYWFAWKAFYPESEIYTSD